MKVSMQLVDSAGILTLQDNYKVLPAMISRAGVDLLISGRTGPNALQALRDAAFLSNIWIKFSIPILQPRTGAWVQVLDFL